MKTSVRKNNFIIRDASSGKLMKKSQKMKLHYFLIPFRVVFIGSSSPLITTSFYLTHFIKTVRRNSVKITLIL